MKDRLGLPASLRMETSTRLPHQRTPHTSSATEKNAEKSKTHSDILKAIQDFLAKETALFRGAARGDRFGAVVGRRMGLLGDGVSAKNKQRLLGQQNETRKASKANCL